MLRGAFILAVGYIAGFAHATARNDEVARIAQEVKRVWADLGAEPTTTSDDDVVEGETPHE